MQYFIESNAFDFMSSMNVFTIAIVFLVTFVNGELNCSTHNPCGAYGYCRDDSEGQWTCECKFWWKGTVCNEQSSSGKQIIALGCILGFMIILFYGLQIGRSVYKRRRKPKQEKKKEIKLKSTLGNVALGHAKSLARFSSLVVLILSLLVAAGTLIAKWLIMQPIHNEIVNRYLTQEPIYYIKNPVCKLVTQKEINVISFPIACFVILVLIIRTKRTSLLRNRCFGYGAPPMPVDFLSHVDRKFAAFISAVCADELLFIMQTVIDGSAKKGDGIILTFLLRVADVIVLGIRYYAILAAVYLNTIIALACATLYAWLDFALTIINQSMCETDFYPTYEESIDNASSISDFLDYYGTGPNLIAIQLCTDIPRYLCLAYISVKLPILLITKIYLRFKKDIPLEKRLQMKLTREQRIFFRISNSDSPEMIYVRNLFRSPKDRPPSQSLIARILPKKIYEWRDDYKYSTRIVCLYSSIALLLYFVTIQACVQIVPILASIQNSLQTIVDTISTIFMSPSQDANGENVNGNTSNFPMPKLIRPYLFAVFITLFLIVVQLTVFLVNVRRNSFQSYRGDDSEIPRRVRSKYVSYASGNFHFAGYFIGYLIWGFMIIAVFAVVICICIEAFIVYGSVRLVESILKFIIPSLLFVFFKQYLNKLLAQYIFLQHFGEVLSLNNRRFLMIFIYFNFFLDAFLGFISSILRLVKSVVGGILYMCRLDYSPLGRKLETFDGGFSAYCGFIHTECAHRHPVLLVAVSHLYTKVKMRQMKMQVMNSNYGTVEEKYEVRPKCESRYIRKWKLAAFLIRNPALVFFRKGFLNELHEDDIHFINDIDNDDRTDINRRLSVFTRNMAAVQQHSALKETYRF